MGLRKSSRQAERQNQIGLLDRACARQVKLRDECRCRLCGKYVQGRACQWAHLISRDRKNVRWDWENSLVLCQGCHYHYTLQKDAWIEVCRSRMGEKRYEALRARAFTRTGATDLNAWAAYVAAGPRGVRPW